MMFSAGQAGAVDPVSMLLWLQGQALSLWANGVIKDNRTDPNYANSFFSPTWLPAAIGQVFQNADSDWPFDMADFRAYDRALSDQEIADLSV